MSGANIGLLLKSLLEKRGLSMRKLSRLSGIDPATISRIINGKQQAKLSHLKQFSRHLHVPLEELVNASVGNVPKAVRHSSDMYHSLDSIQDILESSDLFDQQFTADRVRRELEKYEKYALTAEGNRIIHDGFRSKVEQVNGAGPFIEQLKQMFDKFCDENTSLDEHAILGSVLLYFILSADIIPDYAFPIGYLDDAIAVKIVLDRLSSADRPADAGL
ncbi:helix-turn-helix domain-containing protein [Sporolactobacillus sp. KGMB 08714]|uniref:helix-turn-helix domain-containing protein n=1 Tax=Sporolactobacillus sp. KGMB 08714 TaxID=3064704 RepID=UPI002FBE3244